MCTSEALNFSNLFMYCKCSLTGYSCDMILHFLEKVYSLVLRGEVLNAIFDVFAGRVAEFDTPTRLLEDKSSMFLKLVTEYSSRSSGIPDF